MKIARLLAPLAFALVATMAHADYKDPNFGIDRATPTASPVCIMSGATCKVQIGIANLVAGTFVLPSISSIPPIAANSMIGNASGSIASPTALTTLPSALTIPSPTVSGTATFLANPVVPGLPGLSSNVQGTTGIPGLDGAHWMIWNKVASGGTYDPKPTLRVDRHIDGGNPGPGAGTHSALLALCSTNSNNQGFEWCGVFEAHYNHLGTTGAQNVAINGTAFKEANGLGEVGTVWGGNFVGHDLQMIPDPSYATIGAEIDVYAVAGSGTDANNQRVALQIVGGTGAGADPTVHIGQLLLAANNGVTIDRFINIGAGEWGTLWTSTTAGAVNAQNGINLSGINFAGSAYIQAAGHKMAFEATQSRYLEYNGGVLNYAIGATCGFQQYDGGEFRICGHSLDSTGTTGGMLSFNSTSGALKFYDGTSLKTLANLEGAQTFSGVKTFVSPILGAASATSISATSFLQTGAVAVGSLPTCDAGAKGSRHFVTDANATTFLSTVAAGGANNVPVVCDGTNWVIGAQDAPINDNFPISKAA